MGNYRCPAFYASIRWSTRLVLGQTVMAEPKTTKEHPLANILINVIIPVFALMLLAEAYREHGLRGLSDSQLWLRGLRAI